MINNPFLFNSVLSRHTSNVWGYRGLFPHKFQSITCFLGGMQRALLDLRLDLDSISLTESPYEALYNASSCHSLDSICSGRSSDRDSLCREIAKTRRVSIILSLCVFTPFVSRFVFITILIVPQKERPPPPAKPPPEEDEDFERRQNAGANRDVSILCLLLLSVK